MCGYTAVGGMLLFPSIFIIPAIPIMLYLNSKKVSLPLARRRKEIPDVESGTPESRSNETGRSNGIPRGSRPILTRKQMRDIRRNATSSTRGTISDTLTRTVIPRRQVFEDRNYRVTVRQLGMGRRAPIEILTLPPSIRGTSPTLMPLDNSPTTQFNVIERAQNRIRLYIREDECNGGDSAIQVVVPDVFRNRISRSVPRRELPIDDLPPSYEEAVRNQCPYILLPRED